MLYWIFSLSSVFLIFITLSKKQKEVNIVITIAESILIYFSIFIIITLILFLFKIYSLLTCTILTLIIISIVSSFMLVTCIKIKVKYKLELKDSYMSYIAIIFMLIFTAGNFGFFGMGQDQGVYQTEAINLYYGNNNWTQEFETYDKIKDKEYKDFFEDSFGELGGFDVFLIYQYDNIPIIDHENAEPTQGTWHGIPSFASILALSAKLFGLENMPFIQTIFYACILIFIEFTLRDRKVKPILRAISIVLIGISPQLFWIKKSTLTECFLALLIVAYIYYIINSNEDKKRLSVLPIVTFCFFHVTAFTILPIFIINYWLLYCETKEKKYINFTKIILIGYILGFFAMLFVQPRYTTMNYKYGTMNILLPSQTPYLAVIATICAWIMTEVIYKRYTLKLDINKIVKNILQVFSIIAIIFVVINIINILKSGSEKSISLITLIAYSSLSGFVILPAILYTLITKRYKNDLQTNILLMMFLWCIIIYSIVMKSEIQYYYYYGRYLAPFISIIVILFAELFKDKNKYFIVIPIIAICLLFPYSNVIRKNQDDTKIEWKSLVNILESLNKEDIVLVDGSLKQMLFCPITANQKNDVYIVMNEDYEYTIKKLDIQKDTNIILISEDVHEDENIEVIKKIEINYQADDLLNVCPISSLSLKFNYMGTKEITLYRVKI